MVKKDKGFEVFGELGKDKLKRSFFVTSKSKAGAKAQVKREFKSDIKITKVVLRRR